MGAEQLLAGGVVLAQGGGAIFVVARRAWRRRHRGIVSSPPGGRIVVRRARGRPEEPLKSDSVWPRRCRVTAAYRPPIVRLTGGRLCVVS